MEDYYLGKASERIFLPMIKSGVGVTLFFCFMFQVEGLALTTSNRNAFICGLSGLANVRFATRSVSAARKPFGARMQRAESSGRLATGR